MELAAASEMSLGYRVDKQPTWHPIWRARYRVAVDCRPEVPVPRSTTRSCRGRLARWRPSIEGGRLRLEGSLLKPDGSDEIRVRREGGIRDAAALGTELGRELRRRAGAGFGLG